MVVCLYQPLLQRHTSIKEQEMSRKPRQGSSIPPGGNSPASRTHRRGRGEESCVQRASHRGDQSSHPPTPFPKVCFLNIYATHFKLGKQTRQGQGRTRKGSTCLMDKSWVDLISSGPEGLVCWQWVASVCGAFLRDSQVQCLALPPVPVTTDQGQVEEGRK